MDRLRRLEVLVRAAEAGSFAKAALALDLTPSAVSHSIADLERELRVSLFHRTTRQLRLTEDGEELYRRAREILSKLAEAETALARGPARVSGTLRVGLGVSIARHIIMPRISDFIRRNPELKLECRVVTQVKEMHASGLDLLLRVGEPPKSDLIARKLAQVRFGLYAAPAYLKSYGEPANPRELARHRCLIFKPEWSMKPLDQWRFERDGEQITVNVSGALTSDDRESLVAVALAGGGIIRAGMLDPSPVARGDLKRVLSEWTCSDAPGVYALYRRTGRVAPKVIAFLEFAADAFGAFDPEELTLTHERR